MTYAIFALVPAILIAMGPQVEPQTPAPGQNSNLAQLLAADRGDTPEVRALGAGSDPNARDEVHQRTALMWSIFHNDRAAFDRFIAAPGVEVNAKDDEGDTPLVQKPGSTRQTSSRGTPPATSACAFVTRLASPARGSLRRST